MSSRAAAPGAHAPVMLGEVIDLLSPRKGAIYVDGTFGAGGYSRAILEAAPCRVIAVDRDPEAIGRADALTQEFGARFTIVEGRFGEMASLLAPHLSKAPTASRSISASPRPNSTTNRAASRSAPTVRSTCGWRNPAPPPPTSSTRRPRASWPISFSTWATNAIRAASRAPS